VIICLGKILLRMEMPSFFPNAIDLNLFSRINIQTGTLRRILNLSINKKILITVSNIRKVKNHSFLIKVFNELLELDDDFVLVIIGDGPDRNFIEKLVHDLKIESFVYFLGQRNDIPNLLVDADLFLLPSLYEGVPGVIIEAIALNLKCIVSDNVTRDIDFDDSIIKFLPINKGYDEWIRNILLFTSVKSTVDGNLILMSKGYDREDASNKLINIYKSKV
jgi:glycosyltransferase involved in cell wall biosynthesis